MFGSLMLDVAIGMVLVYLLLSFVAAAVREGVETVLKERSQLSPARRHRAAARPDLTAALFSHPQVSALYRGDYATAVRNKELPSYIPSRNFALALLDIAVRGRDPNSASEAGPGSAPLSLPAVRQNVSRIGNPAVQRVVLSAIDLSGGDFARAQASIESWFDSAMDRVSGWYKHRTQRILIVTGIIVAVVANVDTIRVAHAFYNDPGQRQLAIAMAGQPDEGAAAGDFDGARRDANGALRLARRRDAAPARRAQAARRLAGPGVSERVVHENSRMAHHRLRDLVRRALLVRPAQPNDGGSLDGQAAREESGRVVEGQAERKRTSRSPRALRPLSWRRVRPPRRRRRTPRRVRPIDAGDDYKAHEWSSGFPEAGIL